MYGFLLGSTHSSLDCVQFLVTITASIIFKEVIHIKDKSSVLHWDRRKGTLKARLHLSQFQLVETQIHLKEEILN